ncbi:metallophosphoesterase [Formicincola oecophyllae]|nr:metallophosphoesterase [Formicincola oecophyllae]
MSGPEGPYFRQLQHDAQQAHCRLVSLASHSFPVHVRASPWMAAPLHVPGPVMAIGDVHGMALQLDALLGWFNMACPDATLVILGDLVDRGDDSALALALTTLEIAWKNRHQAGKGQWLLGNHETTMLAWLAGNDSVLENWAQHGGRWLLPPNLAHAVGQRALHPLEAAKLRAAAAQRLPPSAWQALLTHTHPAWEWGTMHFAHAGVDPTDPTPLQSALQAFQSGHSQPGPSQAALKPACTTIRNAFLKHQGPYAMGEHWVVVHGHSITKQVGLQGWRLSLDSGCFMSGVLSAALVEQGRWRLIQAMGRLSHWMGPGSRSTQRMAASPPWG